MEEGWAENDAEPRSVMVKRCECLGRFS